MVRIFVPPLNNLGGWAVDNLLLLLSSALCGLVAAKLVSKRRYLNIVSYYLIVGFVFLILVLLLPNLFA